MTGTVIHKKKMQNITSYNILRDVGLSGLRCYLQTKIAVTLRVNCFFFFLSSNARFARNVSSPHLSVERRKPPLVENYVDLSVIVSLAPVIPLYAVGIVLDTRRCPERRGNG